MAERGVSAVAVGAVGSGLILVWSGLKGASVLSTLRSLIQGQRPTGQQTRPISHSVAEPAGSGGGAGAITAAASTAAAAAILSAAQRHQGKRYCMGGGHASLCGGNCWDCSGYVSCALHEAGVLGSTRPLATGGLARWGTGVPYAQRQPGDVIVWLGGVGNGHTGIIATVDDSGGTMWNNSCTACPTNYVHLSRYPTGTRTATAAIVRRAM